MFRIFLVEDDPQISGVLVRQLSAWDYEVRAAEDYRRVTEEFRAFSPHLVLLDIGLPYRNGYHWCEEIRKISQVPIVFLSSASDNLNIVTAMTLGADDFIAKPFDLTVLHAKLLALLRRAYDFSGTPALTARGATLRASDASLVYAGSRLPLSRNEYGILQMLMERRGQIVSREALMERLWETDSFVDENTLSVNVNRLRKKLDAFGLSGLIETRKGLGYIIG